MDFMTEEEYPEYTPVRHKNDGYRGWIYDTTTSKNFFTGNIDCKWQYRIYVNENCIKIAPREDLEINYDNPTLPLKIQESHSSSGYRRETELHALGYRLTDTNHQERINILKNVAIPYLGIKKVITTIANLIYGRLKAVEKNCNALYEWNGDLDALLVNFDLNSNSFDEDLLNYILNIKIKLEKNHINMQVKMADIKEALQKRRKV